MWYHSKHNDTYVVSGLPKYFWQGHFWSLYLSTGKNLITLLSLWIIVCTTAKECRDINAINELQAICAQLWIQLFIVVISCILPNFWSCGRNLGFAYWSFKLEQTIKEKLLTSATVEQLTRLAYGPIQGFSKNIVKNCLVNNKQSFLWWGGITTNYCFLNDGGLVGKSLVGEIFQRKD